MDVAVTIALGGVLRSETPQPKIIMDDDFRPDSSSFFCLPAPAPPERKNA